MLADPRPRRSALTLGHSKHPLEAFLGLVVQHGVEILVDVRSHPVSRFSPQFSRKALEHALTAASVRYLFMGHSLDGRPEPRACCDENGKLDYDCLETQAFYRHGITRPLEAVARYRVCLLCAEEDPAGCHRRLLITRTLTQHEVDVQHIRGSFALEPEQVLRARSSGSQLALQVGRR